MSALQRLAPRMAGLILIALGFCISVMQAYLFGRARGEMSAGSSPDFLRLLHSARHNAAIAFVGGIVIFALGHVLLYRSSSAPATTSRKFSGIEP
jgi:uncharacterized membrane protein